jgi:hypothetical protein
MIYTKTKNIEIGDHVHCLTEDSYEHGIIRKLGIDTITVFMGYIGKEIEFPIDLVQF